jgi:putative transcriptional regulator
MKYTNNLKQYRKEKGLLQKDLAETFGVTKDYISMIERGSQTPGLKLAYKIASYFNTTIEKLDFFCESNEQNIRYPI